MTDILLQIILGLLSSNTIALFSLFVLTCTLIAVIIYTMVTVKLQKTAEKQTEELIKQRRLSIMPSLFHNIEEANFESYSPENALSIKNIGHGVALNISIDDIKVPTYNICFKIAQIDFIKPGEYFLNKNYIAIDKDVITRRGSSQYLQKNSDVETQIAFTFQDIEGNKYKQINKFGPNGYCHGPVLLL